MWIYLYEDPLSGKKLPGIYLGATVNNNTQAMTVQQIKLKLTKKVV